MENKDYYRSLGVSHTANADAIKSAYHKLALKYHPDHNPGNAQAEEKFKEINAAYRVLSDAARRARYDQETAWYERQRARPSPSETTYPQNSPANPPAERPTSRRPTVSQKETIHFIMQNRCNSCHSCNRVSAFKH